MFKSITLAFVITFFISGNGFAAQKASETPIEYHLDDPAKIQLRFTAGGGVSYLVVSCIDFRLRDELEAYASGRWGKDSYDEVALAGASLGVLNDKFQAWNQAFTQNLDVAIQLHGVNTVVFIDHRDCGAYKNIVGATCCETTETENAAHEAQMSKIRAYMKEKYPSLKVETLLMNLDGTVETFGPSLADSPEEMGRQAGSRIGQELSQPFDEITRNAPSQQATTAR
jgi:hypothetical protein